MFEQSSELLDALHITSPQVVLIGDGSGSLWSRPCGWSVIALDFINKIFEVYMGSSSHGSVNYAELYPYIHALTALTDLWCKREILPPKHIDICSDSEVTVRCGSGIYGRTAHGGLWASIEYFGKIHQITWNHIPRNTYQLHILADKLSKHARMRQLEREPENAPGGQLPLGGPNRRRNTKSKKRHTDRAKALPDELSDGKSITPGDNDPTGANRGGTNPEVSDRQESQ